MDARLPTLVVVVDNGRALPMAQNDGAQNSISTLDCPVEGCFKILVHKGGVCPLLQQHLGVLRPVVESCPMEWRHPLRVLMVDLTEAGLLQQDYEEPVYSSFLPF